MNLMLNSVMDVAINWKLPALSVEMLINLDVNFAKGAFIICWI
jgi:hypothetical protein